MRPALLLCSLAATSLAVAAASQPSLHWETLPAIPDREGFAGSFAGMSRGALLVAGGANFPEKRPWEGGTKLWHDRVFVLERGAKAWRDGGRLPRANGYGVSIDVDDGVLLVGGGDAKANFSEVWHARWDGKTVRFDPRAWPALPRPLAMAAGARVDRTIYVFGGMERPDAAEGQRAGFALDLDRVSAGWRELPAFPGAARILATAASHDGAFYVFSGARLFAGADGKPQREWLRDAWRFTPAAGWKRVADLPRVAVAAPSPAPLAHGRLLILGGDDGEQVATPPTEHRGFPRDILAYDPAKDAWTRAGEMPFSLVTTSTATWDGRIVVPGGEARPGVRSTAVWAAKP